MKGMTKATEKAVRHLDRRRRIARRELRLKRAGVTDPATIAFLGNQGGGRVRSFLKNRERLIAKHGPPKPEPAKTSRLLRRKGGDR